jgi:hypothetical protein
MTLEVFEMPIDDSELERAPDGTCFVISPIGDDNSEVRERADTVYYNIVEPAAAMCGLTCLRSDKISSPGIITTQIIGHVINDRMVVADLSGHNPNVFYELALRHAFRKPVVQLLAFDQKLPFDVQGVRTVKYEIRNAESTHRAREAVQRQIQSSLTPTYEVESPVTIAARVEELSRSSLPQTQTMFRTILEQITDLNRNITDMTSSGLLCRPEDLKEVIPGAVRDQTADILKRFSSELELLNSVKEAGVIGIEKRRESALKAFARDLDEELRDVMLVGSSLKGLLQKDEYREVADKLRFKINHSVQVKFLLTHPIVADFRASQENRRPTEIGVEIINSLKILKAWGVGPESVRLYLGTPTCFAIRTSKRMVINPYPYISVSYDSPCLMLDQGGYLFDQFKARHFGAWDTGLAVHIQDFDETIRHCEASLEEYASDVNGLLGKGRGLDQAASFGA